jgi:hypothetical protein
MNFTRKQNGFLCKCIGVGILLICLGFVFSMCLHWPKEFRSGVFNRLAEIGALQQENSSRLDLLIYELERQLEFKIPEGE